MTLLAWDSEHVDWGRFDVAVIRSTWDSVDRPDAYLAWASAVPEVTTLLNPVEAIAWNLDKTYLRTLAARGVPVVPTQWVVDEHGWAPPPYEFVVKPSISGGGRETARYRPDQAEDAGAHVRRLLSFGKSAMVQPYLPAVDTAGETKLVFVDGRFSHAVRAGAQLRPDVGVHQRPWEHPVPLEATETTRAQLDAARLVLAAVDAELGTPLLYARVDLVTGPAGDPLLAEVEMIDPSLFLRLAPAAAGRLAEATNARATRFG